MAPRPPGSFRTLVRCTAQLASELGPVRKQIAEQLGARHVLTSTSERDRGADIVLVASELTTNALRHGVPPAMVCFDTDERSYLLDVADRETRQPPHVPQGRAPGAGGLGLLIACELADSVGWYRDGESKHVWASFTI